jgi:hypothetical protein
MPDKYASYSGERNERGAHEYRHAVNFSDRSGRDSAARDVPASWRFAMLGHNIAQALLTGTGAGVRVVMWANWPLSHNPLLSL